MVGALLSVAVFGIFTDLAYMPSYMRLAAQITAGAFIACNVEKEDLKRIPKLIKPAAIMIGGFFCLTIVCGTLIHWLGGLDWVSAFMSAVPGGMSDIPIITADMGGNSGKVAVLQFARLVTGIGVFPSYILFVTKKEQPQENAQISTQRQKKTPGKYDMIPTLLAATAGGLLGKISGVPVGALLFSLIAVLLLKLKFDKAFLPVWMKRTAQVLSGCYVGCSVTLQDVLELKNLVVPVLILLAGYFINCYVCGKLMAKWCGMSRREAMLATTPAGASDMALISADLGVSSPDLVVLQVVRLLTAISVFPQLVNLLVWILT